MIPKLDNLNKISNNVGSQLSVDRPYRTGFLNGFWGNFDIKDPLTLSRVKRENVLALSDDLHHYTSLAGLKGIIEENGFWASDNRFMNDAEESWNGIKLARKILQHKAKRSRSKEFKDVLQKVDLLLASPKDYGHFVACFSTASDDLGQWRGYGAGGVCLSLGKVGDLESPLFFGPDHLAHQAIYNDSRKCIMLLSIIRSFEREYFLDRTAMARSWPNDHDQHYIEQLHLRLSGSILGFKDKSFQKESEARIVISYDQADRYDGGLKFRVSPLGIIPYLRTGDHVAIKTNLGRIPLRGVVIGPGPHQKLIAESVKTFLRQKGYSNTIISLSQVPYRTP